MEILSGNLPDSASEKPPASGPEPRKMDQPSENVFNFAEFRLEASERRLIRDDLQIPLTPKAFDTLVMLLRNHGRLLEKQEMLDAIWPGQFVEEGIIAFNIRTLRQALGDDVRRPKFIETVPKRGYRFVAEVRSELEPDPSLPLSFPIVGSSLVIGEDNAQLLSAPLIGRERELSEIQELILREDIRLVTLSGIGGTGKTRLAYETALRARNRFRDGVFWLDISAIVDPSLLIPTIEQSLRLRFSGSDSGRAAMSDYLNSRSLLLAIDNFEQIVDAAPKLVDLLLAANGLKLLVTSRVPLKLTFETEYRVPPLTLPPKDINAPTGDPLEYEAVRFFIERTKNVRRDLVLEPADYGTALAICQKLDGLPLALELAALRAKVLSFEQILDKLDDRLSLLTTGARDVPNRQQTMRSAIAWSYELLNEYDQKVFARLSVFEGGFTLHAAESVISATVAAKLGSVDILDAITSLNEKGLIRLASNEGGEPRFQMLAVVRDYALEIASKFVDQDAVRAAHARFYRDFAEEASPQMISADAAKWFVKMKREHDNIRASLRWSVENKPHTAARLAAAARPFWTIHGHTREGRSWLERTLRAAEDIDPKVRLELLAGLGTMAQFVGEFSLARENLEACFRESVSSGNKVMVAWALRGLGAIDYLEFHPESARKKINDALETSRSVDDRFGIAAALARLAEIQSMLGDKVTALRSTNESLKIFREVGYRQGIASKLTNRALIEFDAENFEASLASMRESMEVGEEIGDELDFRVNLDVAAALYLRAGQYETAARLSGLAEVRTEAIEYPLEPMESRFRERYLDQLTGLMEGSDFEQAVSEGRRMNIEEGRQLAMAIKI